MSFRGELLDLIQETDLASDADWTSPQGHWVHEFLAGGHSHATFQ